MSSGIAPVAPIAAEIKPIEQARKPTDVGPAFTDVLGEARALETTSTDMAQKFANGDPSVGIHEVMIASEKASIALRYATTLKNKAVEAYRELMNTQV